MNLLYLQLSDDSGPARAWRKAAGEGGAVERRGPCHRVGSTLNTRQVMPVRLPWAITGLD